MVQTFYLNQQVFNTYIWSGSNNPYINKVAPNIFLVFTVPQTNQLFTWTCGKYRFCWVHSKSPHFIWVTLNHKIDRLMNWLLKNQWKLSIVCFHYVPIFSFQRATLTELLFDAGQDLFIYKNLWAQNFLVPLCFGTKFWAF